MQKAMQSSKSRSEDWVFEELKRDIVLGSLRPRERLLEADLAERFDVGRHVVRLALDALEGAGLVERRLNRGAVVRDYDPNEIEELYQIREILHRAAIDLITFPVDETYLTELQAINETYLKNLQDRNLEAVVAANDAFHSKLFSVSGNRFLLKSIDEYWLKTAAIHCHAIADPDLALRSYQEHEEMLKALRDQDRLRLQETSVDHMYPALREYKRRNGYW